MELESTLIKDLFVINPTVHLDVRGYFFESYKKSFIKNNFPEMNFIQDNESKSVKGVLRGLHYQTPPKSQTKLVRVIVGEIQDVVVDIRQNSDTYGVHYSINLSADNKKQLLVPKGFLHGFLVLSQIAIVNYKVDEYYSGQHDDGVMFNDPILNINWQLPLDQINVSKKDSSLQNFVKFESPF